MNNEDRIFPFQGIVFISDRIENVFDSVVSDLIESSS